MKRPNLPPLAAAAALLWPAATPAFAQGSLTPPGAPAPTMKSLAQIEPRAPLAAPITITTAGSYYLTTNLVGVSGQNGITINADDVTLDLNGFALIGVPGSLNGITAASARRNIAVRNGVVRGWGQAAIALPTADNCRFSDLRITGNGSGLLAGNQCQVRDCLVSLNPNVAGISVGDLALVQDCIVVSNAFRGILAGNSCRIAGCTVLANATGGNDGIAAGRAALVQNCLAARNGTPAGTQGGGIAVDAGSSVIGCTTFSNAVEGIFVQLDSVVKDSTARNNDIGISTTGGATIQGCAAALNDSIGIWDRGGSVIANCTVTENGSGIVATNQTVIRECAVAYNADDGILVHEGCQVVENNCHDNGGAGIHTTSTDNRIDRNITTLNDTGIRVDANYNLVLHNQSTANFTTNFSVVANNALGTIESITSLNTNKNPHANFEF
jgi:hypothetical protein